MSSQTPSASAEHSHDQRSKATTALDGPDQSTRPASSCQSIVSAATTHPTQPTALVGQQIVPKLKPCLKTPTKRFPEFEGWSSPPTDEPRDTIAVDSLKAEMDAHSKTSPRTWSSRGGSALDWLGAKREKVDAKLDKVQAALRRFQGRAPI